MTTIRILPVVVGLFVYANASAEWLDYWYPNREKVNPYTLTQQLRRAARKGDASKAKKLIQAGANVNDCEGFNGVRQGRMILTEAIDSGSTSTVKALLKAGAKVEAFSDVSSDYLPEEFKATSVPQLSYAIIVGAPKAIINLLGRYSKDLNLKDSYNGWTPYRFAVAYGNSYAMTQLANAGARIDKDDESPIHSRVQKIKDGLEDAGTALKSGFKKATEKTKAGLGKAASTMKDGAKRVKANVKEGLAKAAFAVETGAQQLGNKLSQE